MNCGEKIATLRKQRGMTQAGLGAELNVTFQAVSKWERGESLPDFETMSRIARLFEVPLEYFADGGENETEKEQSAVQAEPTQEREMLGICRNCGKVVYKGDEAQRR